MIKPSKEQLKTWLNAWIKKRRDNGIVIEGREYQFEKLYEMVNTNPGDKYVLAAAPGAGKTLMTIMYIEWRISVDPKYKILVLTHGLGMLREQFKYMTAYYDADFRHGENIVIDLPHGVKNKDLSHIDEIIVDEAHQYYFAEDGMIERLIKMYKPKTEILLTGSPHRFIFANQQAKADVYNISIIDSYTLWNFGFLQDVLIEVASTSYRFNFKKDYNEDGDLNSKIKIPSEKIKESIHEMLDKIMARLRSKIKANPEAYKKYLENGTFENFFLTRKFKDNVGKTMIACRNQAEASAVSEFLVEYGYDKSQIVQSTSDVNSKLSKQEESLINRFKTEPEIRFLVVVNNGILGFDYSELCNVVDLTCSRNVSRLYQLYCRLVRRSKESMDKFYYKVVPYDFVFFFERLMEAVLHLGHEHFLRMFNGRNFMDIHIALKKNMKKKQRKKKNKKKPRPDDSIPEPMSFSSVFRMIKLSHTGDAAIDSKSYTTLRHVMYALELASKMNWKDMSNEQLVEFALDEL